MMKTLKIFWVTVAEYYSKELSDEQVRMYSNDCSGLDGKSLGRAFEVHRNSTEGGWFPLPITLKKIMGTVIDEKSEATAAADMAIQAISKFGRDQGFEARQWMGELAWGGIESIGGWYNLCQSNGIMTTVRAQLIKHAESKMFRTKQGREDEVPSLEPARNDRKQIEGAENRQKINQLISQGIKGVPNAER